MSAALLEVSELCISAHRGPRSVRLVDHLSFTLPAGEIVGLVGESGCGKSLTALALMGLLPRSGSLRCSGSIRLGGLDLTRCAMRDLRHMRGRDMAMIFQEPATAFDPVIRVGVQLATVLRRLRSLRRPAARALTLESLAQVGFLEPEDVYQAFPHQLSGGMRQLAMIALALACRPRLLIADEPTTSLDVTTQAVVLDQLKHLQRQTGSAILLVSHDLGVVAQCCDEILVMYCGRIVEQARCVDLFARPRHPYTAGLLAATPRIAHGEPLPVSPIPGQVPTSGELPPGCHFAARCGRASDLCSRQAPAEQRIHASRVACHHPLRDSHTP